MDDQQARDEWDKFFLVRGWRPDVPNTRELFAYHGEEGRHIAKHDGSWVAINEARPSPFVNDRQTYQKPWIGPPFPSPIAAFAHAEAIGWPPPFVLTWSGWQDRMDFRELGGCSCHLGMGPCSWCTHPGNPDNQLEDDNCWEPSR